MDKKEHEKFKVKFPLSKNLAGRRVQQMKFEKLQTELAISVRPIMLVTCVSKLSLLALVVSFVCVSCSINTGHYRETKTVGQRLDPAGKQEETIQREVVMAKEFYIYSPEGAFTSQAWPRRFEYYITYKNGRRQQLSFLTTHDVHYEDLVEEFLDFFPISEGRWIAVNLIAKAPVRDSLRVCVFNTSGLLFTNTVTACRTGDPFGNGALRAKRAYDYEFDSRRDVVKFRTQSGNFEFDPNTSKLNPMSRE
jgi:hypothetical protein